MTDTTTQKRVSCSPGETILLLGIGYMLGLTTVVVYI